MLPLKKIVCPTDFSEPSFEALQAAVELARHFSAELIVVHVVQPIPVVAAEHLTPAAFNVPAYQAEMEISSRLLLKEQIEKSVPEGITATPRILLGDPADQIVQTAADEKADLIVIATRGQTGFKRLVFGSVAEKTVRLASRPVLTIPARSIDADR